MSITVLNYLDHTLVNEIHARAAAKAEAAARAAEEAARASKEAAQTSGNDFSSALEHASQTASGQNSGQDVSSLGSYSGTECPDGLASIFEEAGTAYGVSSDLLKAIAKTESAFHSNAVSRSGAVGIMQLMPATAASLGVVNSYDPAENIMGGAKLISQLLTKYNGNVSLALAAYNAGSGNVDKYGGIPPFTETQNYVKKVLGYLNGNETASSGENSSIFNLSGSDRTTANEMLESYFQSKNISKEALDLLALALKLSQMNTPSSGSEEETGSDSSGSDSAAQGIGSAASITIQSIVNTVPGTDSSNHMDQNAEASGSGILDAATTGSPVKSDSTDPTDTDISGITDILNPAEA